MTPNDDAIPAASLVDVWRNPDDPRWKEAHDRLGRIFTSVARKHPRVKSLPTEDEKRQEVAGLFSTFWCYLTAHRQKLEASRIRGAGAIRVEAWRFLDQLESDGSRSEMLRRLKRHLRNEKVVPSLKEDPRFCQVIPRGPWLLATWEQEWTGGHVCPPDDSVCGALPELPARLTPQRPDQLPPIVDRDKLPDFLVEALLLSNRPRRDWDLTALAWRRLRPEPESMFLLAAEEVPPGSEPDDSRSRVAALPDQDASSPEAIVGRERWARQVDLVATALVDSLPDQRRRVVQLHLCRRQHQDIARELGVSRGTIHNELGRFKDAVRAVVDAQHLDEEATLVLLGAVLNILEAERFYPHRGDETRDST